VQTSKDSQWLGPGKSFWLVRVTLFLGFTVTSGMPSPLFGWGQEGHRIIAAIAESRLSTGVAEEVRQLIGDGGMASVANWADEIRPDRPETAFWHYVNIPRDQEDYIPARDCAAPHAGDCIIAAMERFQGVLENSRKGLQERAEALKFVIHLVGDLHQPLHCLKEHEGGTMLDVLFYGERLNPFSGKSWNLHAVWDGALIYRAGLSEAEYIRVLNAWLDLQPLDEFQQGTVRDWALESQRVAISAIYHLPPDRNIQDDYVRASLPVVGDRLARAGVRLAMLLNKIFGRAP
jgi:hypothetical protein